MDMTPAMVERQHDSPDVIRATILGDAPSLWFGAEPAFPAPATPTPQGKPARKKRASRRQKKASSKKKSSKPRKPAAKKRVPASEVAALAAAETPSPPVPLSPPPVATLVATPADNDVWPTAATPLFARPKLRILKSALDQLLDEINAHEPEHGGILLGPVKSDVVTAFLLDNGARRTATTFAPNAPFLNEALKYRFVPAGMDCKGVVHSHPSGYSRPSPQDLDNIRRLFLKPGNEQVADFLLPIVCDRTLRPFVILRSRPDVATPAELVVF